MLKRISIVAIILLLIGGAIFILVRRNNGIDDVDIKLADAEPLASITNRLIGKERLVRADEPDAVSEKIAQSLIVQLEGWGGKGKGLAQSLRECSALQAIAMENRKSSCVNDYSGEADVSCLIKHGIGQKSVGQSLTADRFDLNVDGVPDYIISDRYYCNGLSANQSNVYFVMLSDKKGGFKLAYADWASFGLQVVEHPVTKEKILIEQAPKNYGVYSRIMQLVDGKYVSRICVLRDDKGYSRCDQ